MISKLGTGRRWRLAKKSNPTVLATLQSLLFSWNCNYVICLLKYQLKFKRCDIVSALIGTQGGLQTPRNILGQNFWPSNDNVWRPFNTKQAILLVLKVLQIYEIRILQINRSKFFGCWDKIFGRSFKFSKSSFLEIFLLPFQAFHQKSCSI